MDEALGAGADVILLDNMTVDADGARRCGASAGARVVEASGGVTLATVRAIAETGVDLISVGALTHSAPAIDLSMRVEPARERALRSQKRSYSADEPQMAADEEEERTNSSLIV